MPVSPFLRTIPSVSKCLDSELGKNLQREFGATITTTIFREVLSELRDLLRSGARSDEVQIPEVVEIVEERLIRTVKPIGRRAINATGIMIHTGLGRSPLCKEAIDALSVMDHFSLLELDIESGERGTRDQRVEVLLKKLTNCEAATVVNNNAAATLIILKALASGKEVIISRGQLIEIGGSFRMPDIMEQSGAILREVGTTNRTHLKDYEKAINDKTGAIIHVHPSNYRVRGFASTPEISDLVKLGHKHGIPVIDDIGSGALIKLDKYGINEEPLVHESIDAGSDIVCFSGDKLICGPQAGIICGKHEFVEKVRKDPFYRMFRMDKLCIAALEATLIHFINGEECVATLPIYQMLAKTEEELRASAERIKNSIASDPRLIVSVANDVSYAGGGSSPDREVPTVVVKLQAKLAKGATRLSMPELAFRLRQSIPCVLGRVKDSALIFDMRTLLPGDEEDLISVLNSALAQGK